MLRHPCLKAWMADLWLKSIILASEVYRGYKHPLLKNDASDNHFMISVVDVTASDVDPRCPVACSERAWYDQHLLKLMLTDMRHTSVDMV